MKMIPKNTIKIMNYLLRNFELSNINQISKKLKISVGSVFKILNKLEKNNIVLVRKIGNASYYSINLKNQEAIKLSELILLEEKRNLKGYSKIYADEIKDFKNANLIILFGSILKNKEFNDVDILFVTNKVKEVNKFCLEISKIRTKPLVPLILKKSDLIKEIKNKRESILEIIKTGVIIKGESVLLEVVKNVKT
ncbi:MAG TPA: ArsR family transcriptional regulator [Ignavibacteria bacterium]|nr:ArsR family transcriptional regulator [Ignavibacteria bacterium]